MPRRLISFDPGEYYHLYNRGVNRGTIYFSDKNYRFFLMNIERYLLPVMDLVAYCLMPTHFHLLISVKKTSEVPATSEVSKAMMKLAVSYTKALNHSYDRVGPLFQGAFQAKHVDSDGYLWKIVSYIHLNPVQSGLVQLPEEWIYSSYYAYQDLWPDDPETLKPIEDLRGHLDLGGLHVPYLYYNQSNSEKFGVEK